jgi:hypothetical protein
VVSTPTLFKGNNNNPALYPLTTGLQKKPPVFTPVVISTKPESRVHQLSFNETSRKIDTNISFQSG